MTARPPVGDTTCHFCYQPATKSRREKTANGFRVRAFCVDCASIWDDYSARVVGDTTRLPKSNPYLAIIDPHDYDPDHTFICKVCGLSWRMCALTYKPRKTGQA